MSKEKPVVFQLGDGSFVDPNGNPVKKDGTPLKAVQTEVSISTLTTLPEGVKPAIVAVPGVGDKLADKVIEAINAYLADPTPAESELEPEQE